MDNDNPYATPQFSSVAPNQYLSHGYPRRRMRFWNIHQLKAEMRSQPLSERESLPYLVMYAGIFSLFGELPNPTFNLLDALDALLSVAIAVVGTVFIYLQNGGINGKYFLQRYFAVGFVVAMRCLVAFTPIMFGFIILLDTQGILSDETTWYDVIIVVAAEIFLYWRIAHHVRDLAQSTPQIDSMLEQ